MRINTSETSLYKNAITLFITNATEHTTVLSPPDALSMLYVYDQPAMQPLVRISTTLYTL